MKCRLSGDNVNMATVTRELLDLIMKLTGKERAAWLKKLNPSTSDVYDGKNTATITTRLIDAVMKNSMDKRCEILGELKALNGTSKRRYSRMEYIAPIHYIIRGRLHNGYIKNISISGLFIEGPCSEGHTLFPGEPISMNFDHPETKKHLKITGHIARITKTGLGVCFTETL